MPGLEVPQQEIYHGIDNFTLFLGQGRDTLQPVEDRAVDLGGGLANEVVDADRQGINQLTASGTSTGIKVAPTAAALPNPGDPARTYGANDLFALELRYDQLLSGVSGTARKDGNIAQVIWRTRGRERQAYSASYDYLSRMSVASYYDITDAGVVSSDQKFREEVSYADARGNIKTLKRNGMYPSGAAWAVGQIDNLTYGYTSGTNKLATVTEAASTSAAKPLGFNPGAGGTGYGYDKNGNLTKDIYKGITAITYNYLNLPGKISFGSSKSITFTYDATGRKLKKVTAGGAGAENYTQYYADGLEYRSTTLEAIYHEEGRLTPKTSTTWQYEYAIRDHLGNSRVTFADKNADGKISVTNSASTNEVLQENHYTPFGLELGYAWMNDAALVDSKYRFGGKELNEDFGLKLNDFGAKWYDPATARWLQVDPLADSYTPYSPYNYTLNNPLRFVDPDGRLVATPDDWVQTSSGAIVHDAAVTDKASAQDRYGSGATYIGESAVIQGSEGTQISLNKGGRITEASFLPTVSVTAQREGDALAVADNVATTTGLATDATEVTAGVAASLAGNAKGYDVGLADLGKSTSALGKITGGVGALKSASDLYNNPSVGNTAKLVYDVALTGAKMHPAAGIGAAVLDLTGTKDSAANGLSRAAEGISYQSWLDFQTITIKR